MPESEIVGFTTDKYAVRKDPELAYQAFMSMGDSEWQGLLMSMLKGGVLQPAEQVGFERALTARKQPRR